MTTTQYPVPPIARVLGYAGLIPFVALAGMPAAGVAVDQALVSYALRAYAATIVSFLGAIHWGFAMQQEPADTPRFVWGVLPSLLAWLSLVVVPTAGTLLLAAALWLCFLVDRRTYPQYGLGAWLPMRLALTTLASAACVAGGLF